MSPFNVHWADGVGKADMEAALEAKLQAVITAKEVALHLSAEYEDMLSAACASQYHPRARLRRTTRMP